MKRFTCHRPPVTRTPWKPEEDDALRKLWNRGDSIRMIARFMGRTHKSIKLRRFKLKLMPRRPGRISNARNALPLDEPDGSLSSKDPLADLPSDALPSDSSDQPTTDRLHAILLLSDLHIGQVFTADETDGTNAYSTEIFLDRFRYLEEQIRRYQATMRAHHFHILFLGDIVHGALEHGAEREKTLLLVDQFSIAIHTLFRFLKRMSQLFSTLTVRGVAGNHGRWPGQRSMPVDARHSNFDTLVYRTLEAMCGSGGLPSVKFDLSIASRQVISVGGMVIQMLHGDQIRSSAQALHRELLQEAQNATFRRASTSRSMIDLFVMGHKHQSMMLPVGGGNVLVNGSFVGTDLRGMDHPPSSPSQVLFWIEEGKGKILHADIDLKRAHETRQHRGSKFRSCLL